MVSPAAMYFYTAQCGTAFSAVPHTSLFITVTITSPRSHGQSDIISLRFSANRTPLRGLRALHDITAVQAYPRFRLGGREQLSLFHKLAKCRKTLAVNILYLGDIRKVLRYLSIALLPCDLSKRRVNII